MNGITAICKRELRGYFQTPVAYVFLVVFLIASGAFTFYLSNYFQRGVADLEPFFMWHPWLYLFLVPAVTMRLWAEERHSGTIELIMTLPVEIWQVVAGKFLAAWLFVMIALLCTLPIWLTVNYLGNPDNGVILVGYLGSILMSAAYLAIGGAMSATTSNQVIAFILAATLNLVFVLAGYSVVTSFLEGWMPRFLLETIVSMSFLTHYEDITKGVLEMRSLIFFVTVTLFWLYVTLLVLEKRKGGR